jgi:hypothetical protein
VLGDIPATERVRDAWESWSTDRRRAAIRAVLHRVIIKPLPPGANANVAGNSKNKALRREREMVILRQRAEFDWRILVPRHIRAAETSRGDVSATARLCRDFPLVGALVTP